MQLKNFGTYSVPVEAPPCKVFRRVTRRCIASACASAQPGCARFMYRESVIRKSVKKTVVATEGLSIDIDSEGVIFFGKRMEKERTSTSRGRNR